MTFPGATLFTLGYLKLGAIVGFFPRHILVGWVWFSPLVVYLTILRCIGGVGAFLIQTGFVPNRLSRLTFTIYKQSRDLHACRRRRLYD